MTQERRAQIEQFLDDARQIVRAYYARQYPTVALPAMSLRFGRRYVKVVIDHGDGASVWAFIDLENGDILKPASWRAPARHARGNLDDPNRGLSRITPFGPEYLRR